jgi:endoglucanase
MTSRTLQRSITLGLSFLSLSVLASAKYPLALHTSGNRVLDSDNKPVLLRGVNCASMEWTSDGDGRILKTVEVAIHDWHVNIIRLPVSQDRWFGFGPEQKGDPKPYRTLLREIVEKVTSQGCYLVFDLHWNDAGNWGPQTGQHVMPDDNSLIFWRDAAREFRDNPGVIFDLYNEPHNVSWDAWKNGGIVADSGPTVRRPTSYHTPGMQAMLDNIRDQGAKNLVICGGLDWSYDLSGFLKGYALSDPYGNGVLYACHTYPFKGDTIAKWLVKAEAATQKIPVIFSEFGDNTAPTAKTRFAGWTEATLKAFHDHRWNWIAWDLHPAAGPTLISNWDYKPTASFGEPVKKELSLHLRP